MQISTFGSGAAPTPGPEPIPPRAGAVADALLSFAETLRDGLGVPDHDLGVLFEAAEALIASFEQDGQSPAGYRFLRIISAEAAEVIAGLLELANFPTGAEDPAAMSEAVVIAYAGALAAAGRHDQAIDLIARLLLKQPNRLALSHAMFVARCKHDGLSDDLTGRFCPMPFADFEVLPGGFVHLCCAAFMGTSVGNIFHQDFADVWNGAAAQAIRQSIHDGSFRCCDKLKCPHFAEGLPLAADFIKGVSTARPVLTSIDYGFGPAPHFGPVIDGRLTTLDAPPAKINLSFDRTCNLACPSCRSEFYAARPAERDAMLMVTETKIMPVLETADMLSISGSGDPFASKACRYILHSLQPERCPRLEINIATNGVLFTPAEWEQLARLHGRIGMVHVSLDAAEAATYAVVRRGGDWARVLVNLEFLVALARDGALRAVNIVFVVQARNWREMPDFVRLGRRLGVNCVYFSLLENWGTFSETGYEANAVQYPGHRDHRDFLRMLAGAPELDDPIVRLGSLHLLRESARAAVDRQLDSSA
jgi:pyruvate-formate lyase-activating enzyme